MLQNSFQEQNADQLKLGLYLFKSIIPLGIQWEQICKNSKLCNLVDVEIAPLVDKSLKLFEKKIQEKKIRIIKNDLNHTILSQENILGHFVFNNLLENAIKYSPIGHDIFISAYKEENSCLKITIEDHGVGIPKEFMDTLIDVERPQLQVGTLGEKGFGGGLAMVDLAINYLKARWEILPLNQDEEQLGTQANLYFTVVK